MVFILKLISMLNYRRNSGLQQSGLNSEVVLFPGWSYCEVLLYKVNNSNLGRFEQNGKLWYSCHLSTNHGVEYSSISKVKLYDPSERHSLPFCSKQPALGPAPN